MAGTDTRQAPDPRRSSHAGILIGIGIMAAVDEIVFHQILAWHHFIDGSTPAFGLLTDGLLHAAELLILVGGFFLLADLQRRQALARRHARAGFLLGAGGFQLFDGIVDHKILGLHQIRYVEPLWPYDLAWNGAALIVLLAGLILLRRARASLPGTA